MNKNEKYFYVIFLNGICILSHFCREILFFGSLSFDFYVILLSIDYFRAFWLFFIVIYLNVHGNLVVSRMYFFLEICRVLCLKE